MIRVDAPSLEVRPIDLALQRPHGLAAARARAA